MPTQGRPGSIPGGGTKVKTNVPLDEDKHARLVAIADARGTSIGELVRESLERVIELATTQQDNAERAAEEYWRQRG